MFDHDKFPHSKEVKESLGCLNRKTLLEILRYYDYPGRHALKKGEMTDTITSLYLSQDSYHTMGFFHRDGSPTSFKEAVDTACHNNGYNRFFEFL